MGKASERRHCQTCIKICERYILVDMEKIKEEGHNFFWGVVGCKESILK